MLQLLAIPLLLAPVANVSAPVKVVAPQANVSATVPLHPFSVHDMLAMDRITDPRVSPDGTQVVFSLRTTDLEANKGRGDIWSCSVDGTQLRSLTGAKGGNSQPRWSPDGKSIYFLSSRSGTQQVWRMSAEGGEATQVTTLPVDVDNLGSSRWQSSRAATLRRRR
jgi:dipeptidyl aminopeptidase/acylaminoacyl peptidase